MAGHRAVCVDELYTEINRALTTETKEIEESVNVAANIVTKELLSDIREDSPVNTGAYKKGWKRKKLKYHYVVYNKEKPWLTHIAEYGRAKQGGGRVEGKPHIKKNEERAVERFEDLCVDIVSDGLRLKP